MFSLNRIHASPVIVSLVTLATLLARPIAAGAVDLDDLTVVTLARDGSWGVATAASQGPAIAGAVRDCRAMAGGPSDCGAQFATTRGGWIVAKLCGDHKIIVAAETRQAADQAALARELALKRLHVCTRVLTVGPQGVVLPAQAASAEETDRRWAAGTILAKAQAAAGHPAAITTWAEKRGPEFRAQSLSEPGALADQHRCMDAPVDVTAASEGERHLVCSAASHALQLLGRCGISLRRPLHVQIVSEVRHPFNGAILGLFDVKQDRVLITQEVNVPSLIKDTPVAKLAPRDFYRSLIVHEVVHGVMHQNLIRPLASHAAAEYPAYALQIESLPPDVRDSFLQSFDLAVAKAETFLFNDIVLSVDPFSFAASAYKHLKALGNGCGHLQALLAGEARFIAIMPAGW